MSEAWTIFLLGVSFSLLVITIQIWSTFNTADKFKEAKYSLIIGLLITISFGLFTLIKIDFLQQEKLRAYLFSTVQIIYVIIWTIFLLLSPKLISILVNKITSFGTKYAKKKKITKKINKIRLKTDFSDNFKTDLNKWEKVSGSPQISFIRGIPNPPSLLLEENPKDRRDSYILAKDVSFINGIITCDVYLEREAVLNLVFRCNTNDFYMARIDSRAAGSSGILISRDRVGNWGYIYQPNISFQNDVWHHLVLSFKNNDIKFQIDEEVFKIKNKELLNSGRIGLFNEVKRVFVNNFSVIKT